MLTRRRSVGLGAAGLAALVLAGCGRQSDVNASIVGEPSPDLGTFERGTQVDRGFEVDDLLRSSPAGDIHFSLHVPDGYDGSAPVRMDIGQSDDYYGSGPVSGSYEELRNKYVAAGLTDEQVAGLLVLDVKPASYFGSYASGQHAGGAALFAHDADIMGWLFSWRNAAEAIARKGER